jgi:type IV pilus assembly protein PilY1
VGNHRCEAISQKDKAMDHRRTVKTLSLAARIALVLALGALPAAQAEDIDLFLNNPMSDTARPNLLIVVDNAANNNSVIEQLPNATGTKKLDMIKDVINILVDPLNSNLFPPCTVPADPTQARTPVGCVTRTEVNNMLNNINVGLMLFNTGGDKGGYVRSHIRPMNDATNRARLWATVSNGIPTANNSPYAKAMHEAFLYFGGRNAYVGFSTNAFDTDARDSGHYRSPITDACQPNFIIYLGNGGPDSSEDGDARTLLNGLGGVLSTDPLRFTPDNFISNWMDEYARTLNKTDMSNAFSGQQKVTTYTIAIQTPTDNQFTNSSSVSARKLLENAALQGGGEYALGQDGQTVLKAILSAVRKMQPVNSVFAAVTLPVSVNVRGTFLNQVYMGQFRPDRNARPRWPGNLKQYQIGLDGNDKPILTDRNNAAVEDTANGFLLPDITSFWTRPSNFWGFTTMSASDAPDGAVVEKGGTAQRMRTDLASTSARVDRKLYTCNGNCVAGAALSSVLFDTSNDNANGPSETKLGVVGSTSRNALIEWVRGADNAENENADGVSTDVRAYLHGDLLHSRPAVVNYNRSAGDRDIVVYYGSNDGVFRAVKGGQDDADGGEKWGMVFPEFFDRLRHLRANNTVIGVDITKPYFADGPVSVYQKDANNDRRILPADGDKVWVYVGMRRGGNFIYALDVTDPDTPKFMWKVDRNSTVASGHNFFEDLGQTWSTVRPAVMAINSGNPVVIFGGGYDAANEDPNPPRANQLGQGIFVLDAERGTLIKYLTHNDMGAIVGDVTLLDRDGNGRTDRIYAGDSKGNVWRIDAADADPDNWTIHKLAALGGTGADGRKFLNKIDVVPGRDFDAILVGSGDREHPFLTSVVDRFYMIKDTFRGVNGGRLCGAEDARVTCTHEHLTDVTGFAPTQPLPSGSNGWYLTLGTGEKMVSSPITAFGTVIFGTNQPITDDGDSTCGNLGQARVYQISFDNGGAVSDLNADGVLNADDRSEVLTGGGFPPAAVLSRVNVRRPGEQASKPTDVVCVGTHCFKPGGTSFDTRRYRTYWYKK